MINRNPDSIDAVEKALLYRDLGDWYTAFSRVTDGVNQYLRAWEVLRTVLHGTDSCYVFDLGGGSLECLAMRARQVETAISLPLGCVRLTERFVSASELPLDPTTALAVQRHVHAVLREAHFDFDLPSAAPVIGTGGSVFTCRAMVAAQTRQTLEESSPVLPVPALQSLGDQVMAMPLAMRQKLPGLPAARADVFPAAIITLLALMAASGRTVLHHSVYNLRYGVADELLTG